MRKPSIHISIDDFESILNKLDIDKFPIEDFFRLASSKSINTRSVNISNKKNANKMDKITLATKGDAYMVSDIIYSLLIKKHIKGIRKINETDSRNWLQAKKLAEVCNQFCEDANFSNTREGFIKYIEIGIASIHTLRNMLSKLIQMYDYIYDTYRSIQEVEEDKYSEKTKLIHDYYILKIANNTGITDSYINQPVKYVNFVRLNNLLRINHWDYHPFIDAQFEALEFCNGIPSVESLYGEKAIERYNAYLYKRNEESTPQVEGSLWDKLKNK
jgi:hypothetical protein